MFRRFEDRSSHAKTRAQQALAGRTHYVDDDALRFFKARILVCKFSPKRLLCGIVESGAVAPDGHKREFRPVVFDIFGTVIDRPEIGQGYSTKAKAEKEMWAIMNRVDEVEHTKMAAEERVASFAREKDYLLDEIERINN